MKSRIKSFFKFIIARHKIWYAKEVERAPRPWTDDHVLHTYKFCNVYRKLDIGTKLVIQNVCNSGLSDEQKVMNIILYRRFNTREFFGLFPAVPGAFRERMPGICYKMDEIKRLGGRLFSDAYTICQRPFCNVRPREKHMQVLFSMEALESSRFFVDVATASRKDTDASAGIIWKMLQPEGHRIGPFLAYQILQDLQCVPEFGIIDGNFVHVGPGAIPSIRSIFGSESWPEVRCRELWEMQHEYLHGKEWAQISCGDLTLGDIQGCLCEFRKYENLTKNPGGHKKRYYEPQEARLL